jgi:hypothetical protein
LHGTVHDAVEDDRRVAMEGVSRRLRGPGALGVDDARRDEASQDQQQRDRDQLDAQAN